MARPPLPLNSHGSISVAQARPGLWRARCRYRDGSGRVSYVERSGASRTAAQRALVEEIGARRGRRLDRLRPHHRLSVAIDLWQRQLSDRLARGDVAATSVDRYRYAMAAVRERLGELRIGEITPGTLDAAFTEMASDGRSASTRRIDREVLDQVLDLCVRHGVLVSNPAATLPRIVDRKRRAPRALSAEQRRRLFAWLDGDQSEGQRLARQRDLPDIIRLMVGTGARIGEVMALRWSDIDLDGRPFPAGSTTVLLPSVTVAGNIVRVSGSGLTRHLGKTAESLRVVPIPATVAELLRARRPTDVDGGEPVFPSVGRHGAGFTYREPRTVMRHLAEVREELGWPWLTTHVLRKTSATILHEAGVSDLSIGEHIGHTDRASLMNVYLGAGDLDVRLVDAMDAALRDP